MHIRNLVLLATILLATSPWEAKAQFAHIIQCSGNITTDLQTAIDGSPSGDYFVQISDGSCQISSTVKVCNKEGLRIEGASRGRTVLQWTPDALASGEDPMFSLQNSNGIAFSNFSVCIGGDDPNMVTLNSAFDMYNACFDCTTEMLGQPYDQCDPSDQDVGYFPGTLPHSHGNSMTNIDIASCRGVGGQLNYGVRVKLYGERANFTVPPDQSPVVSLICSPTERDRTYEEMYSEWLAQPDLTEWEMHLRADCYNEHHSFTNVRVSEFRKSAFVVEGRNSLGNTFTNVHCDGEYDQQAQPGEECCGEICVETGQNQWVIDHGNNEWLHDHVEDPVLGLTTQGHFFWFGGSAKNIADSVFVLGHSTSPIAVYGLSASGTRSLVKALVPSRPRSRFPLIIDSVRFSTDGVHRWDNGSKEYLDNEYGIIVDYPYHGPLVLRNNTIGDCSELNDMGNCSPNNVSLHWHYVELDEDRSGSFVFEANSIASTNENPFNPLDSTQQPITDERYLPIYPSHQTDNLLTVVDDDQPNTWTWAIMPQHFTTIELSGNTDFDVSMLPTSDEFFLLTGNGILENLQHGIVGQEITIIVEEVGLLQDRTVGSIAGNIKLAGGSWDMGHNDALWLMLDPDGYWREIGRGDN